MNTIITKITSRLKLKDTVVVGIAGGSGSGKSHYSAQLEAELNELNIPCVLINQDDFAIGRGFKKKKSSRYKWDDPENHRLDECIDVISKVSQGKSVSYDAYSLLTHEPSERKTIEPIKSVKKVIILEGILAWYGQLDKLVDLKIYIDVNFFVRFILRANRNVNIVKNSDLDVVIQQFFTHVMYADTDILLPMSTSADITLHPDIDLTSIVKTGLTSSDPCPEGLRTLYSDKNSKIQLYHTVNDPVIRIEIDGKQLFDQIISVESLQAINASLQD